MSRRRPARSQRGSHPTRWLLPIALALAALTAVVYANVWSFDYVGVDDPAYVSHNAHVSDGLTAAGTKWAFTTGEAANWHPVTWLSLMLDVQLFGNDAGAHHAVNLILHVANVLLLFWLFARTTGAIGASAFVAALFAVHPLHVESVAWISERKDVLSTLFWVLTMVAYTSYTRRPKMSRYVRVMIALGLGLMAKPMLVTLPIVLLLWDVWPLQRMAVFGRPAGDGVQTIWACVREKLPMFALVIGSSVATVLAQQRGGAVTSLDVVPLALRTENALISCMRYIGKLIWPIDLTMYYPLPAGWPLSLVLMAAATLVAMTVVVFLAARRWPWLAAGWLWYVVTLIPVIGLVQVGRQAMADRYTYVPYIGLFVMIGWGAAAIFRRWRLPRLVAPALALAAVCACAVITQAQVQHWRNDAELWTHALQVRLNLDEPRARLAAGDLLADKMMKEFVTFLESKLPDGSPGFDAGDARHFLGLVFAHHAQFDVALDSLTEAIQLKPTDAAFHLDLGRVLSARGRRDAAIKEFAEVLRLQPSLAEAHNDWGVALMADGKAADAITHFAEALRLRPDFADARRNLALAQAAGKGR